MRYKIDVEESAEGMGDIWCCLDGTLDGPAELVGSVELAYADLIVALLNKHEREQEASRPKYNVAALRQRLEEGRCNRPLLPLRAYCNMAGFGSISHISHLGALVRAEYERRHDEPPQQRTTSCGPAYVYGADDEPWIIDLIQQTLGSPTNE